MHISVIGISHKTAPIDIREKFYLDETRRRFLLSELKSNPAVAEAIVLSTCNRTEVYAHTIVPDAAEILFQALFKVGSVSFSSESTKYFYAYKDREAVRHLLRVAGGLESVVLGENQILGQVKTAIDCAREEGMLGKTFNILSAAAIRAGKKARHETAVGAGGVSVSWAAVSMAERMLGTLKDRSVLIIGAGKMANLAANHLANKALSEIYVMNRSHDNARALAGKFSGISVSFWEMKDVLRRVDVCICSAGAPHYLVEKDMVQEAMAQRPGKPLVCVDISIPRNIDPAVREVQGVSLITVDDLGGIVTETIQRRRSALSQVDGIIEQKVDEFYSKITENTQVKAIVA